MDLRSLRYFCAAAEAGSLTAAAERCHVAQPSISNAVAQLEQEFALRLFSRSKRGVTLTPEGEAFYQGHLAKVMEDAAIAAGAALRADDLASHAVDTVEPMSAQSQNFNFRWVPPLVLIGLMVIVPRLSP